MCDCEMRMTSNDGLVRCVAEFALSLNFGRLSDASIHFRNYFDLFCVCSAHLFPSTVGGHLCDLSPGWDCRIVLCILCI